MKPAIVITSIMVTVLPVTGEVIPVSHAAAEAAVRRYLPVLQDSLDVWAKRAPCQSCHHHALGLQLLIRASNRGIPIRATTYNREMNHLLAGYRQGAATKTLVDAVVNGEEASANPAFAAYMLYPLQLAGVEPDLGASLAARWIAMRQGLEGNWKAIIHRPPLEASDFAATALVVRMLGYYLPGEETSVRIEKARNWLLHATPESTEDRAWQLFGLRWAGAAIRDLKRLGAALLTEQRHDGGWAQLPTRSSDAYATGEVLVALHEAGLFPTSHPAYQKGLRFLLATQLPDGSWFVPTRHHAPMPGNAYFETSFPHGESQFISCAGSNWAALALLEAIPKSRGVPSLDVVTRTHYEPWMRTATLGTASELRVLLDGGLDPNTKTAAGVTLLMLAVADPEKVKLLVERGADVNARAKGGATALTAAAPLEGNTEAIRSLLAAGADANLMTPTGATPLSLAATGDRTAVRLILDHLPGTDLRFQSGGNSFYADPLAKPVALGDENMVRLLVENGADVNSHPEKGGRGVPVLSLAVINGQYRMVKLLLSLGADVNYPDPLGMTPLLWAAICDYGRTDIAEALLTAGADSKAVDKNGSTPAALARIYQNVSFLQAANGKQ
jgi:ankyrin repeat protein